MASETASRKSRLVGLAMAAVAACLAAASILSLSWTTRPREISGASLKAVPGEAVVEAGPTDVVFMLCNMGDSPVVVTNVVPHCGCTVARSPDPPTVPPHGESRLVVRATPPNVGEKTTRIDVYCEGGDSAPLPLMIKLRGSAPTFPSLTYDPREVIVRGLLGQTGNADFKLGTVESRREKPWIESLGTDAPQLTASILDFAEMRGPDEETVRREYHCRIMAQLDARGRQQLGNVTLNFRWPNDGVPRVVIQIMSDCTAAVEAVPDTLFASIALSEVPRTFTIGFRSLTKRSSLTLAPSCDASWIKCESTNVKAGSPFLAAVSVCVLSVPKHHDAARATISVNTNVPECPTVEIPVVIQKRDVSTR